MEKINRLNKITDKVLLFRIPLISELNRPSESEMKLWNENGVMPDVISRNINEGKEYQDNVRYRPDTIVRRKEICYRDYRSRYVNISNGRRITSDNLGGYKNNLYVLGNSVVAGYGSEDKYTIPSFMQRLLNGVGKSYKVINCGVNKVFSLYNVFEEAKEGDRIIIILGGWPDDMNNKMTSMSNIQYHPLRYFLNP